MSPFSIGGYAWGSESRKGMQCSVIVQRVRIHLKHRYAVLLVKLQREDLRQNPASDDMRRLSTAKISEYEAVIAMDNAIRSRAFTSCQKRRPPGRRLTQLNMLIVDQAAINAGFAFRRQPEHGAPGRPLKPGAASFFQTPFVRRSRHSYPGWQLPGTRTRPRQHRRLLRSHS
jgi:hypothetical protein